MNFEDVYACYVVRDKVGACPYVGDGEAYRVALRGMAARFTKQQALDYIEREKGDFLIEDAL